MSMVANNTIAYNAMYGNDEAHANSINELLAGTSIDINALAGKARGTYNMGEIVVRNDGGRVRLDVINNHVTSWRAGKNNEVTTWEERYRTNMAVFKAILEHYARSSDVPDINDAVDHLLSKDLSTVTRKDFTEFGNRYVEVAFEFLLGKDNLSENARPLSRDETAYLLSLLDDTAVATEADFMLKVKRLNELRAFKAGNVTDPTGVRDLVKGFSVENLDSEKRARMMQVSVNQRAAAAERVKPRVAPLLEAEGDLESENARKARELKEVTKILDTQMKDVGRHIQKRIVEVARKYGGDLADANSWDVAKTLSKGVVSKIIDAVDKYNARLPEGEAPVDLNRVAKAAIRRMTHGIETLLNDAEDVKWSDAGWYGFAKLITAGFNRKAKGGAGFPSRLREDNLLLTGAPRQASTFVATGEMPLEERIRNLDKTNALQAANELRSMMSNGGDLSFAEMTGVLKQIARESKDANAATFLSVAMCEYVQSGANLADLKKILVALMGDGDLSVERKALVLEQALHSVAASCKFSLADFLRGLMGLFAKSGIAANDAGKLLKHMLSKGKFSNREVANLAVWVEGSCVSATDAPILMRSLLKNDGLRQADRDGLTIRKAELVNRAKRR